MTDAVYAELLQEAKVMLRMGESVVIDATWTSNHHRELARRLASEARAHIVELQCEVDTDTALSRSGTRGAAEGVHDASDATPEVAAGLAQAQDPWLEARRVLTDRPAVDLAADLDGYF